MKWGIPLLRHSVEQVLYLAWDVTGRQRAEQPIRERVVCIYCCYLITHADRQTLNPPAAFTFNTRCFRNICHKQEFAIALIGVRKKYGCYSMPTECLRLLRSDICEVQSPTSVDKKGEIFWRRIQGIWRHVMCAAADVQWVLGVTSCLASKCRCHFVCLLYV